MVDSLLTRVSALAADYHVGTHAALGATPGIVLRERRGPTLMILRGASGNAEFLACAQSAIGVALPTVPNSAAAAANVTALWLAPDEWLISGGASLPSSLAIAHGTMVDISHGRTVLRVSGARSLELLAKGCALDLHPSAFAAGHCAQTAIARINVLLHRVNADADCDVYCARSHAVSLWRWVTSSAAEFGYQVAAPMIVA